ncbi:MAG TPA: NrfD/PsrC family molybdoenzyme membrane anchor subunit [Roseiflexaceae bacterium]|nr:NrfD/PsrC family molybdoenzyme membrane anchor subunit [Roseiflexaceae bacterium]
MANEQPEKRRGYYGLPVLKRPHWGWEIVLYFWGGGIAVGAYTLAALADLLGDEQDAPAVEAGRALALPLMLISPILLIKDLGRPEKFYNMLRILKLKSPMSVGSWVLSIFGGFAGLSMVLQLFFKGESWRWARQLAGAAGAPFALLVGSYTGVLLAATAIPLWFKNRLLWGPVFLASAFSTGIAAVQGLLTLRGRGTPEAHARLEQAHTAAVVVEGALLGASLVQLGRTGDLLTKGRWSTLFWPGVVGLGLLAPLLLGRGHPGRSRRLLSALCTLLGGLALRTCLVYGGRTSADDPQAYFDLTS